MKNAAYILLLTLSLGFLGSCSSSNLGGGEEENLHANLEGLPRSSFNRGGVSFTLADIPIGTHLYRYFNLDIARPDIPNVDAWYGRLQQRPAFQKNVMLPFDDLYGRLAH